MKKALKLTLSLPLLLVAPDIAFAEVAAPVEIAAMAAPVEIVNGGSTPLNTAAGAATDTASATAVDSALDNSVATESSSEKKSKYSKHSSTKKSSSYVTGEAPAPEATPAPEKPVTDADYTIRAGDVLQITVWKEDNLDREVLVLADGTISFPLIGAFSAQGLTPSQLQVAIKSKLHSLIPGASVAVLVKAPLGHTVSVIGQVNKPGEIIAGHNLTVMQALSQAAGLTPYASVGRIIVLRTVDGKETSIEVPYDDIIYGEKLDKDITLKPGDVVVVPTASLF